MTSAIPGASATVEATTHATHAWGSNIRPEPCRGFVCDDGLEAEQASFSWGKAVSPWLWGVVNNTPCHVSDMAATRRIVFRISDLTES